MPEPQSLPGSGVFSQCRNDWKPSKWQSIKLSKAPSTHRLQQCTVASVFLQNKTLKQIGCFGFFPAFEYKVLPHIEKTLWLCNYCWIPSKSPTPPRSEDEWGLMPKSKHKTHHNYSDKIWTKHRQSAGVCFAAQGHVKAYVSLCVRWHVCVLGVGARVLPSVWSGPCWECV